jgi:hypothetical protein
MKLRWLDTLALSVNGAYALLCLGFVGKLLSLHALGNSPEHALVAGFALLALLWLGNVARILCPLRRRIVFQILVNGAALAFGLFGLLLGFADPFAWTAPVAILPPALTYLVARRAHAKAS